MRHNPFTGVFNEAYNNHAVRFNVQDAYLESDITDDGSTYSDKVFCLESTHLFYMIDTV
jgi:hypothetical protein